MIHFIGRSSVVCTGEYKDTLSLSDLISKFVVPEAQAAITAQFQKQALQPPGLFSCVCLLWLLSSQLIVADCAVSSTGKLEIEIPCRHSGSIHYVVFQGRTLFRGSDQRPIRALGTCVDMTEHYRYRREMEASRSKSLFLAALSHELRKCVGLHPLCCSFVSLFPSSCVSLFALLCFSPLQPVLLVLSSLLDSSNPLSVMVEKSFPQVPFPCSFLPFPVKRCFFLFSLSLLASSSSPTL